MRSRDNVIVDGVVCDNMTILEAWVVASSQLMEFCREMLVGGTADDAST